jgi:chlorophyll/bacteriochlorophyll a synthase
MVTMKPKDDFGHEDSGAIVPLLVVPQITLQDMYFLCDLLKNDVKYQASAQPFLVLEMLMAGLALGS